MDIGRIPGRLGLAATLAWLGLAAATIRAQPVTLSNAAPRRDIQGNILDAHDGRLIRFGDRFYLYGTVYGKTTGVVPSNWFRSYSSPDLVKWTPLDTLLKGLPLRMQYRPHVVFNKKTRKYVLFYNWYSGGFDTGKIAAAVADRPEGPFTVANQALALAQPGPGDFNVLVDYDETAYMVYTSIQNGHTEYIERLSEDYLTPAGTGSVQVSSGGCTEASSLFKHRGLYFLSYGECCCFCSQGAGVKVFRAVHPMGPYEPVADINRDPSDRIIIPAQQTMVAEVPVKAGTAYLWTGDRWFSAPDGDGAKHQCHDAYSGTKGWDFQYWSPPLSLDGKGGVGNLGRFVDSFTLDLREKEDEYNVAAHADGATATASSAYAAEFFPGAAINGDRDGSRWERRGGWNDGTPAQFPDHLEIAFDGPKTLRKIDVYTLQDDFAAGAPVTAQTVFTKYGAVDFDLEYHDKGTWKPVPGGAVAGNDRVLVSVAFPPLTTDKIRVVVKAAADGRHSRIVEVEAWGKVFDPSTRALSTAGRMGPDGRSGGLVREGSRIGFRKKGAAVLRDAGGRKAR